MLARGGDPGRRSGARVGRAARWRATRCSSSGRTRAGILQVVTIPISIGLDVPDVLGTLSIGVLLDERLADQLKHATQSEVAFALNNQVRAATLPRTSWASLLPLADKTPATSIRVADADYVASRCRRCRRKRACRRPAVAVAATFVLQSRTERLRFPRTVETALLIAAIAAVLLATVLSYAVARTVTRPLGAITNMMREVAVTGDLTRKITLRGPAIWQDEDARLLATTYNGLTDSIARFQREAAQKEQLPRSAGCPR